MALAVDSCPPTNELTFFSSKGFVNLLTKSALGRIGIGAFRIGGKVEAFDLDPISASNDELIFDIKNNANLLNAKLRISNHANNSLSYPIWIWFPTSPTWQKLTDSESICK